MSLLSLYDVDCYFANLTLTRFKGQHLAENTEELKKLLDERRIDEILLFLQKSHADTHVSFQVKSISISRFSVFGDLSEFEFLVSS